jgi:riboflavin synthase
MFTGIIQDIGSIERLRRNGDNIEIAIRTKKLARDIAIGDSVSISGVCLTATSVDVQANIFTVAAVRETLLRSTLGELNQGDDVNLELALQPTGRLGGHFVQGHVDAVGRCLSLQQRSGSWELRFEFPREYTRFIVDKGSIAIDGVSLTIYNVKPTQFAASIIPHTWSETTLQRLKSGSRVNLEFDLIAKYVAKMTHTGSAGGITPDKLREYGY